MWSVFMKLNQLCTVLMLVAVVKFLMAVMYFSVGWIHLMVIWNPANFTDLLANWNFYGEKTIPFWLQWERMEKTLKNASHIFSDHWMMSSMIFSKSFSAGSRALIKNGVCVFGVAISSGQVALLNSEVPEHAPLRVERGHVPVLN